MAPTDVFQEPQNQLHRQPLGQADRLWRAAIRRWWAPALLAALAALALVTAPLGALRTGWSSNADGRLTYTVTRGDLVVTVTAQGILESSANTEIKCKVRGRNTIIWVIENGSQVKKGDVLLRLDTKTIEDAVHERSKYAHWSRSSAERSEAQVTRAELAIPEYLEGRYRTELMTLQKELIVARSDLQFARKMLAYTQMMAEQGYASQLELDEQRVAVKRAELNVEVKQTEIDVLQRFTKAMQLETLQGNLNAAKARNAANWERAEMDATRRDIALEELEHCVVRAPRDGLVIYPATARWRNAPEIAEGATVHKDQVLLLMPDLSQMQVKVGIHESAVDRVRPGQMAKVTLVDQVLQGEVTSVASVTRPAGWWTGNVVTYDTIVKLPPAEGLRPGMSAEVEVIVGRYRDVLTVPVAAVLETPEGNFCWVKTQAGFQRRRVKLGDTNNVFTVVQAGLQEGDTVLLNVSPLYRAGKSVPAASEKTGQAEAQPVPASRLKDKKLKDKKKGGGKKGSK